jgi:hypothetical protein
VKEAAAVTVVDTDRSSSQPTTGFSQALPATPLAVRTYIAFHHHARPALILRGRDIYVDHHCWKPYIIIKLMTI